MKQVLYILQFCFFSLLFLSSSTPLVKKDALDSIGLYQGDELVGKWREFDDPVLVEILLHSENDTLLFHCSSDVRWMNSSSLFLTVNQLTRKDLFLSFDDSTNYSDRFMLPTSRISRDIETLEVWRQTKNHKQIIFQLTIQRKGEALSQCECLDSVYLLKKTHLDRIQLNENGKVVTDLTYPQFIQSFEEIKKQEARCVEIDPSAKHTCPAQQKNEQLDEDFELIRRVVEMNAFPKGHNEIENSDK